MRNNMTCKIKHISKVNLLLKDNHILELPLTRFMPDLQRNCISLGKLDDEYDISIHKGFTKVNLNSKDIISSTKVSGIFVLQTEPLVGNLSTVV